MPVQMLGEALSPAAEPRRAGQLVPAAVPGRDADGTDWRKEGVIVWPEAAPGWEVFRGCDPAHVDHGLRGEVLPWGAVPFFIRTLTSSPYTTQLDILTARADRQIRAVTSQAVAHELWTGALAKVDDPGTGVGPWTTPAGAPYLLANPRPDTGTSRGGPWLNPHLDAAELLDPQPHPAAAVAAAEAATAARLAGGPVFVHVPPEWVVELHQFGVQLVGDVLRTPTGGVVVADDGYPGTHGDDGPPCCYGTGPVQLWLDEPHTDSDPALVVDFHNNRIGVWSERLALAGFDPQTLTGCPLETTP